MVYNLIVTLTTESEVERNTVTTYTANIPTSDQKSLT